MKQLVNLFRSSRRSSDAVRRTRKQSRRRLRSESLEKRELLAADILVAHNELIAEDVNLDQKVTALDALLVINHLSRNGGSQDLTGMARGEFSRMVDVTGDNLVTPMDALRVINTISRAESLGPSDELVELRLNPRTLSDAVFGVDKFNPATRQLNVSVGEVFNLEASYVDLRNARPSDLGIFTFVANIESNSDGRLEPVLTETQTLRISSNFLVAASGNISFSRQGITEPTFNIDLDSFFADEVAAIGSAITNLYGFSTNQFTVSLLGSGGGTRDYKIRFTDLSLADINIPDLAASGTLVGFPGSPSPIVVTSTNSSTPPRLSGGSINPLAIPDNINFNSRSFGANERFFGELVSYGGYNPAVGLIGLGGVGPVLIGGVPAAGKGNLNEVGGFDAFSIPVKVVTAGPDIIARIAPATAITLGRPVDDLLLFTPVPTESRLAVALDNQPSSTTLSLVSVAGFSPFLGETTFTVLVGSERMLVTFVDTVLNTLTVVRAQNGTSIASFAAATKVEVFQDVVVSPSQMLVDLGIDPINTNDGFGFVRIVTGTPGVIVVAGDTTLNFEEGGPSQSLNLTSLNLVSVTGTSETPVITISTPPARGTATVSGTTITYTPAADDFTVAGSPITFIYIATVGGVSDTGTITVNIANVNDAPIFVADNSVTATAGIPLTIVGSTLLSNDRPGPTNAAGVAEPGTVSIATTPAPSVTNGTVTLSSGNLIFTSAANFTGAATISYTITDGALTAPATLTVNVSSSSVVIVAANDSTISATEDTNATLSLATLTTVTGSTAVPVFTISSQPARGNVTISGSSAVFVPLANDFTVAGSPLTFVYTATVGSISDTGTITVNVANVNDPPQFVADNPVSTVQGIPLTIVGSTLLSNDRPGPSNGAAVPEPGTVSIAATPMPTATNGTVTLSGGNLIYTSAINFAGAATISYTITDGALTAPATLTVNVTAPGVVTVTANDLTLAATEDVNATLNLAPLTTVSGSAVSPVFTITTQPVRGNVTISGSTATFAPLANDFTVAGSPLTFVYTATVGSASDTGTITVTVANVNDAPQFVADDVLSATQGVALTVAGSTLLSNDRPGPTNGAGVAEPGTVSIATSPPTVTAGAGTVTRTGQDFVFTPSLSFTGAATISYTITDGSLTAPASLTVNVVPPVVVTVAAGDSSLSFVEDGLAQSLNLSTLTTVTNSSASPSFTIVSQPARGTLTLSGNTATYTPAADDFTTTPLSFVYRATVGSASDTGTVSIAISPVNDAPVVINDTLVVAPGSGTTTFAATSVTANDRPGPANESSQTVTLTAVSAITGANATQGTVALVNGSIVYTPPTGFMGIDRFNYTVSDGALSTSGVVTVSVAAPSTLSGTIFTDYLEGLINPVRDGVRDSNEPAMGGIPVRLTSASTSNLSGQAVDIIRFTNAEGEYLFTGLLPGTYVVTFIVPDTIVPGFLVPNSSTTILSANSFQIVIPASGALAATGNNFTTLGKTGAAADTLDFLVSNYLQRNRTSLDVGVALSVLDESGSQQFFEVGIGYENVQYIEISFNEARDAALLTVLLEDGTVQSSRLNSEEFAVSSNGRVIRLLGGASSIGTPVADSSALASEFGDYRDSVDAILASGSF